MQLTARHESEQVDDESSNLLAAPALLTLEGVDESVQSQSSHLVAQEENEDSEADSE